MLPGESAWEPGCDCFCAHQPRSDSTICESLGSTEATLGVFTCAFIAELLHYLHMRYLPALLQRWHLSLASHSEQACLALTALAQALSPLAACLGFEAFKLLAHHGVIGESHPGLARLLIGEADRSWFLHAAPVISLWCLMRWLGAPVWALATSCRPGSANRRVVLWERYASLVAVVGLTVCMQPLIPYLAPLGTVGLFLRYWSEKYLFFRGQLIIRTGAPIRTAMRLAGCAMNCLWLACIAGCFFTIWAFHQPEWSLNEDGNAQVDLLTRVTSGAALPSAALLCMLTAGPLLVWFLRRSAWLTCGLGYPPGSWRPVVRSQASTPTVSETGVSQRPAGRLNFQEAWLIMRHSSILASYSLQEHPAYRNGAVLKELQPDASLSTAAGDESKSPAAGVANLARAIDMTCSRAVVGETAPSRKLG